jgi:hypothetical protein
MNYYNQRLCAPGMRRNKVRACMEPWPRCRVYLAMPDSPMGSFPIDPELHIRVSPPIVLCRTGEALAYVRKMSQRRSGHAWQDVLQSFEAAWDEWSAMEAVVKLELLLETEGLLLEDKPARACAPAPQESISPQRKSNRAMTAPRH